MNVTFVSMMHLKRHFKALHGRITFECDICKKTFNDKSNLIKHKKIVHNKIRKYECDRCEKKFAVNHQLKQHMITVHEKLKLHQCQICLLHSTTKGNLRAHMKMVHEKEND